MLIAKSADVSVYPEEFGRSPLQGADEVTVESGDKFGFHIDGTLVTVFSIRLWTQFADIITVRLFGSKGEYPPVDVSFGFASRNIVYEFIIGYMVPGVVQLYVFDK